MIKRMIAVLFCVVMLALTGCYPTIKEPYIFRQSVDQIDSIEIAIKERYDPDLTEAPVVLKILDRQEHQEIIDELSNAEGNVVLSPPGRGIGVYIIQIIYKDGEIEMIGEYNNGYITPEGEVCQESYCFNSKQFYKIISRFIGETIEQPTFN